ncbi:MAG: hypothetical protein D6707_07525 [Bacteroidetes bacterium]|nr:MAG: hypothetical protein D6707_07525 [Bacteroidota bacterium]
MSDAIVKQDEFQNTFADIGKFQSNLNKLPEKEAIKVNPQTKTKYIPISFLEMQLDRLFNGLWQTENFKTSVIANEIVGSIEVKYFHPVALTWITRTGAAAVMIQMKSKDKGGSGDITNIRDKYINTLTKDYPHLKAECFRNACLSIGKSFGRDLNREFDAQYTVPEVLSEAFEELEIILKEFTDPKELKKKAAGLLEEWQDRLPVHEIQRAINQRYMELKNE